MRETAREERRGHPQNIVQRIDERALVQGGAGVPGHHCSASRGPQRAPRHIEERIAIPESERAQRCDTVTRRVEQGSSTATCQRGRDGASRRCDIVLSVDRGSLRRCRPARRLRRHPRPRPWRDQGTRRHTSGRTPSRPSALRARSRPARQEDGGPRSCKAARTAAPQRYPLTATAAAIAAARAGSRTTRRSGSCRSAHSSAVATSSGCCSMNAVLYRPARKSGSSITAR